jgi:hypothetical protein
MAKKKVPVKKVKPAAKKPAAKKAATKKAAPAKSKVVAATPVKKKVVVGKSAPPKKTPPKREPAPDSTLGRPLVTMEEKLYMLFHEDYESRQVFEFLRVDTVGDLIKLSAEEIVRILTAPVRRTINRIRQRLAEKNRSLQGDEEFTRQHQAKIR